MSSVPTRKKVAPSGWTIHTPARYKEIARALLWVHSLSSPFGHLTLNSACRFQTKSISRNRRHNEIKPATFLCS